MPSSKILIPTTINDHEVQIEVAAGGGSERTSSIDKARESVSDAFERAQDTIVAVAASTVATVQRLGSRAAEPDEVQVKFGLKFTAKGTVFVAEASGEATLEVALTYRKTMEADGNGPAETDHADVRS